MAEALAPMAGKVSPVRDLPVELLHDLDATFWPEAQFIRRIHDPSPRQERTIMQPFDWQIPDGSS